jgi:hypothetical protein
MKPLTDQQNSSDWNKTRRWNKTCHKTRLAGRARIAAKAFTVKTFVIAGRLALFASILIVFCAQRRKEAEMQAEMEAENANA